MIKLLDSVCQVLWDIILDDEFIYLQALKSLATAPIEMASTNIH